MSDGRRAVHRGLRATADPRRILVYRRCGHGSRHAAQAQGRVKMEKRNRQVMAERLASTTSSALLPVQRPEPNHAQAPPRIRKELGANGSACWPALSEMRAGVRILQAD